MYELSRKLRVRLDIGIGTSGIRYMIKDEFPVKWTSRKMKDALQCLRELSRIDPKFKIHWITFSKIVNNATFECLSLLRSLTVTPYGDVYACDRLAEELRIGNLKDFNFDFDAFVEKNKSSFERVWNVILKKKCQPCRTFCELVRHTLAMLPFGLKVEILLHGGYNLTKRQLLHILS